MLWLQKGRAGSSGAYRGAHWHTAAEIASVLQSLPVTDVPHTFGVFLPGGGAMARLAERALPAMLPMGAFMAVFAKVDDR